MTFHIELEFNGKKLGIALRDDWVEDVRDAMAHTYKTGEDSHIRTPAGDFNFRRTESP